MGDSLSYLDNLLRDLNFIKAGVTMNLSEI